MLHGIKTEAVEVEALDPIHGIVDEESAPRGIIVEAWQEWLEPGSELGFVVPLSEIPGAVRQHQRAEPIRVLFEDGVLVMNMGENEIQ